MKYEIMMRILFELLSKKTVSASYLADKYEVSVRSIYRYIACIEAAGVPIYTTRGNNGGFSVMDTYKLTSTFLTVGEYKQTISALNAINDNMPSKDLDNVIKKLQSIVNKEYSGFDIKSGNLIIDGGPWGDTVGYKTKLATISKCMDDCLELYVAYRDRNGSLTERTIHPHYVVFKQGLWYVYAYCTMRKEFRFFKTGRIEKANVLNSHFTRQKIEKDSLPLDFWHENVETCDVLLEVDKTCLSDVEEWLGVENFYTLNDKHYAKAKLPFDNGLIMKIMSYGSGIKVVEPLDLKEKIRTQAEEIIKNYN